MTYISKFHVAEEQLLDAINLYIEGRYYSASTLAGAAEEIFGRILEHQGKDSALKEANEFQNKINEVVNLPKQPIRKTANRLYDLRNNLKHISPEKTGNSVLHFRFSPDFQTSLLRAIHNYQKLKKGRKMKHEIEDKLHEFRQLFWANNKKDFKKYK